jgi:hypothetical protein
MSTDNSIQLPHRVKDETGNVYGKLTVISFVEIRSNSARWLCRCECGNEVDVRGAMLRYGSHQSCGCARQINGLYNTSEHSTWTGMIQRCTNQTLPRYSDYGGRGITICERWRNSFLAFYEDMGPKPSPKHSIDRKNNDGNYSCGRCAQCVANGWDANCRWATPRQQTLNSRHARYLTHNGETMCITDWARRTGIKRLTIAARLESGWTVADALTQPVSPISRCHRSP